MDTQQREQIEYVLGRPLLNEELIPVRALEELTPAEKSVAEDLARRQLTLCALYLRSVAPVGTRDAIATKQEALALLERDVQAKQAVEAFAPAVAVSATQRRALADRLKSAQVDRKSVRLVRIGSDERSGRLFEALRKVFADAGWNVDAQAIGVAVVKGPTMPATSYITATRIDSPAVKLVESAFSDSDLQLSVVPNAWKGASAGAEPQVVIVLQ